MRKLEWTPVSSQTITHLIVMSSLFMMIAGCIQPTPIGPKPINAAADASASASATPTPTDSATPPPPPPAVAPTPSPSSSPSATPVVVASPTSGILTGSATPTQNTCVTYTATVDQNALTDIAIAMSSNSGHVTLFTDTTCSTGSGASVNLTIPTGSASVQFSMTDTNSEAVTLSAAATGGLVGTVTKDITVGVAHLNISVAAATAKSNVCLGPFTVEAQNAGNTPITMNPTLSVTLAGAGLGGTFYTDACSTPAAGSAITIANGANSGTFYYKSTGSGARSLTASAASGVILSNTLAATVTPSKFAVTVVAASFDNATCGGPFTITSQNSTSTTANATSTLTVDLSHTGGAHGVFYSDACSTTTTTATITAGTSTATFYYKDTTASETPTLTAADHAGSLTSGTVGVTITTPIPLLTGFFGSTMAVINGKAYCMGTNSYGVCGVGDAAAHYSPVAVNNVTRVTALMSNSSDGISSVNCLVDDGKAKCMGYGVMGDGKTVDCAYGTACTALSPVQVSGLDASGGSSTIATQVAGSRNDTFCALTQNGAVRCWGNNVGDGSTTFSLTPVATTLTSGVTKITSSRSNVLAVQNGALYYWGDTLLTPTLVAAYDGSTAANTVVDVAGANTDNNAGGERFCAVTADGGASCQDGLKILPAGSGASKIVAGASHVCVIYTDGLKCANLRGGQYWSPMGDISLGDNVTYNPGRSGSTTNFITAIGLVQIGQSGTHNNDGVGSPSTFASTDILAIGTGYEHVCVITAGNMMSCWGVNHYGEMGTGSTDNTEYRVAIPTVTA
ncbi:hypothetical protein WDW37_14730, partial [Bdellovibrionota bacterium FG-1]